MIKENYILIDILCKHYELETTFFNQLHEAGLLELYFDNQKIYLEDTNLGKFETIVHLHHDLQINIEGIDAILNLLQKIDYIQQELIHLNNKVIE